VNSAVLTCRFSWYAADHCAGPRCSNRCPNGYAKTKFGCTTCTCAGARAITGSVLGLLFIIGFYILLTNWQSSWIDSWFLPSYWLKLVRFCSLKFRVTNFIKTVVIKVISWSPTRRTVTMRKLYNFPVSIVGEHIKGSDVYLLGIRFWIIIQIYRFSRLFRAACSPLFVLHLTRETNQLYFV